MKRDEEGKIEIKGGKRSKKDGEGEEERKRRFFQWWKDECR